MKACCLEASKSGEEAYFAGLENRSDQILPVVFITKFDFYFPIIHIVELSNTMGITNISKMSRLRENNNFIVSCDNHLMIYDVENKKNWKLMDLHKEDIQDFTHHKDTIITKGKGFGSYKMIKIDDDLKELVEPLKTQQQPQKNHFLNPGPPNNRGLENQAQSPSHSTTQTNVMIKDSYANMKYQPVVSSAQHQEKDRNNEDLMDSPTKFPNKHLTEQPSRSGLSLSPINARSKPVYKRPALPIVFGLNTKYEGYSIYKKKISPSGGLEKVAVNKTMSRIFCSNGSRIFLMEDHSKPGYPIEAKDLEKEGLRLSEIGKVDSHRKEDF